MDVSDQKKPVILVVEQDADQRDLLASTVIDAGCSVLLAQAGEPAIQILRKREGLIDWLYTEVRLAGPVDGCRVADEFRFSHPLRPVIFASANRSDRARCLSGDLFLSKPVLPLRLTELLKDLQSRHFEEPLLFRFRDR
jgi:CheY-like chemotaxis protein